MIAAACVVAMVMLFACPIINLAREHRAIQRIIYK